MQALRELIEKRYKLWAAKEQPMCETIDIIYGNGMILEKEHCFIKEVIYDFELYDALEKVFPNINFHFATIFITYPPRPEEDLIFFEVEIFDIYANSLRSIGL